LDSHQPTLLRAQTIPRNARDEADEALSAAFFFSKYKAAAATP